MTSDTVFWAGLLPGVTIPGVTIPGVTIPVSTPPTTIEWFEDDDGNCYESADGKVPVQCPDPNAYNSPTDPNGQYDGLGPSDGIGGVIGAIDESLDPLAESGQEVVSELEQDGTQNGWDDVIDSAKDLGDIGGFTTDIMEALIESAEFTVDIKKPLDVSLQLELDLKSEIKASCDFDWIPPKLAQMSCNLEAKLRIQRPVSQ